MAVHQTLSLRESRVWPRETTIWGRGGGGGAHITGVPIISLLHRNLNPVTIARETLWVPFMPLDPARLLNFSQCSVARPDRSVPSYQYQPVLEHQRRRFPTVLFLQYRRRYSSINGRDHSAGSQRPFLLTTCTGDGTRTSTDAITAPVPSGPFFSQHQ